MKLASFVTPTRASFGVVDGDKLTCNLHGWEWNLPTGRCLTTKGHDLRAEKL